MVSILFTKMKLGTRLILYQMKDIGALSEENFDAVDWINKTLKRSEDQKNKEAVVSTLVAKLQLYVQQVNSALEETSQQVLVSLPRIMIDAQVCQLTD